MKKDRKNEIEDLQEWLDHQYNSLALYRYGQGPETCE